MGIRQAVIEDLEGIKNLLEQLDYPGKEKFLAKNIKRSIAHPDEALLVFEEEKKKDEEKEGDEEKKGDEEDE